MVVGIALNDRNRRDENAVTNKCDKAIQTPRPTGRSYLVFLVSSTSHAARDAHNVHIYFANIFKSSRTQQRLW